MKQEDRESLRVMLWIGTAIATAHGLASTGQTISAGESMANTAGTAASRAVELFDEQFPAVEP